MVKKVEKKSEKIKIKEVKDKDKVEDVNDEVLKSEKSDSKDKKTKKTTKKTKKKKVKIRKRRQRRVKDEVNHIYVPDQELVLEEDVDSVLEKLGITKDQLPLISYRDPGIRHLEIEPGAVIKITRINDIVGKTYYYRKVVKM